MEGGSRRRNQPRQSRGQPEMTNTYSEGLDVELAKCKEKWLTYRAVFIQLDKVFEWNPPHFPAVVIGAITFLFALLWYIQPSCLTAVSMTLIHLILADHAIPLISTSLYGMPENWDEGLQVQFDRVCVRLCHAKKHIINTFSYFTALKTDKPNMFTVCVTLILLISAWIGNLMDNLLLLYFIVIFICLTPGMRKYGILQMVAARFNQLSGRMNRSQTH